MIYRSLFFIAMLAMISSTFGAVTHKVSSTNGWKSLGRANPATKLQATLVLKQNGAEIIDRLFWEVSNPKHPKYGKYLSHDEIGRITANFPATNAAVEYLSKNGVARVNVTKHGHYVSFEASAFQMEKLFGAVMGVYAHDDFTKPHIASDRYTIPTPLEDHVTKISRVAYFPTQKPVIAHAEIVQYTPGDAGYVTPQLINTFYGIDNNICQNPASSQSVFESLGQDFSPRDLLQFQQQYNLMNTPITDVIGGDKPSACASTKGFANCGEANLDVQYITAVAQNVSTVYWNMPGDIEPFLAWAKQVSDDANPPLVHSISYGDYEGDVQDTAEFNLELQKLGLRGVTVVVSSGDDGVSNFKTRKGKSLCGYNPSFPATSPYATAVGATQGPESGNTEAACMSTTGGTITTGGGFSTIFDRPAYQQGIVDGFLSSTSAVAGYNANGRGIPDVAALGNNYALKIGGKWSAESGTSASAPVFAAMITLINDIRMTNGKPPLGFLNQALYGLPADAFNDIVAGSNNCACAAAAGEETVCCDQGFTATQGWDPVTGLGSPNYLNLKNYLVNL